MKLITFAASVSVSALLSACSATTQSNRTASGACPFQIITAIRTPYPYAFLRPNDCITSPNSKLALIMQPDGNLVEYNVTTAQPLWSTGTSGHDPSEKIEAALQTDGNLIVYHPGQIPLWASHSVVRDYGFNLVLRVQDDGNVVIYEVRGPSDRKTIHPIWARIPGTCCDGWNSNMEGEEDKWIRDPLNW